MKLERSKLSLLLVMTTIGFSFPFGIAVAQDFNFNNNIPRLPTTPLRPTNSLSQCLADLKADGFSFQILERKSKFQAKVRITGTVLNYSDLNYTVPSAASPTTITLYREGPRVALKSVAVRRVKGSYALSYDQEWNTRSPAEGEFPWIFSLGIGDENKGCNLNNNRVEWNSEPINAYLRRTAGNY
ncbi:hypothetical protein [Thiothrix unzii]|uniref:Uncharacterized protein n=1 Tax=Thiothrix unzii TaxID=111769 RepID=A0A975IHH0_9GAMM|nr:hypothetical protein [Thiothrix unzii]QTR53689.1 hypothetical protein J9260_00945 [Thiothrix unzii]